MASDQQKARVQSERPLVAEELYREHHEHIFRFIWSRVYDAQQAEDLTGEGAGASSSSQAGPARLSHLRIP